MPIVFEEVNAEIVSDSQTRGIGQQDTPAPKQLDLMEEIRRELVLMQERATRLKAD